jgi:hypothetical protein
MTNTGLTREQKNALAAGVLSRAADIVEFFDEMVDDGSLPEALAGADREAVAVQLATWLQRLPGEAWDMRLPQVWAR